MKRLDREWLLLLLAIALLAIPACSSGSDDVVGGQPAAQAAEDGLNDALARTGDVFNLFDVLPNPLIPGTASPAPVVAGFSCPEVLCDTGSFDCQVVQGGLGLDYNFGQCLVSRGNDSCTLSGKLTLTSMSSISLTLTGLTVDETDPLTGTASLTESSCPVVVNVTAGGATLNATLCRGEQDEWPRSESQMRVDVATSSGTFVIDVNFNGTKDVTATASKDGSVVANCTIDLDADIPATCTAV